jgi:hypothetical protein
MDMISQMALKSWRTLNAIVGSLTEEQLNKMLDHEKLNSKRLDIMLRIQQRLNAIEAARKIAQLKEEFTQHE